MMEPDPEPTDEPNSPYETELTQMDAQQIWPALQRAKARAAAGTGTSGVLQMGYYCFKSDVGTLTTLGEYVSQMPAKTMLINGTNVAAYCLEHEKGATGGTPYTWTDLTVNAQDTVGTIMALGFQWSAADFWTGPSDNGDKWAVTQLLIWKTINGHAFMQGDGLFGVEAAVDADMEKCAPHAYNPTKFMEYYRDLKKRLNDYMKIPSFASKSANSANTITMKWDGSKYSAAVTDANSVLSNYNFEGAIPGVTITTNGNSLLLSTSEAILTPKASSRIRNQRASAGGKGAVAVWRTSDSSQQNFATYNADGGEPVGCYIKVKTDAVGSAGLVKTSEDGKVEGIQFQITGSDGSSTTRTTDANGNIGIDGLPTYAADGSKMAAIMRTAKQSADVLGTLKLHVGMGLKNDDGEDNSLDIQIKIAEIDAEFKAMLQAIATDTIEDFDEQRATALMAEKNSLEQQLAQYDNAQQEKENAESRLDEIFTILDGLENHPMEYDERLVRQVLECVVVEPKEKIKVIFAGGLEVEQRIPV